MKGLFLSEMPHLIINKCYKPRVTTFYPITKCLTCGKYGHNCFKCTNKPFICVMCSGSHKTKHCQEVICHSCNEIGHRAAQCKNYSIEFCKLCHRKRHSESSCLLRTHPIHTSLNNLKCINCHKPGHLNCKLSKKQPTKLKKTLKRHIRLLKTAKAIRLKK